MNSESGTPALVLIAEKGTEDVGVFPLPGRPGVLSKSLDTDVAIDNPYVSSEHVQLILRDDHCAIRDLGGKNGISLNGSHVAQHRSD